MSVEVSLCQKSLCVSRSHHVVAVCCSPGRVLEREVVTLSDVVRDELVKTSSSEALQQNRQFLATLTVAQVYTLLYVYVQLLWRTQHF